MKIAVDAMTICGNDGGSGAGIEHYTWSLLFSLIRLAPHHGFYVLVPPQFSSTRRRVFTEGTNNVHFLKTGNRRIPFITRHLWHAARFYAIRPDILLAPSGQYPLAFSGKTLITAHDVLIYKHPSWFDPEQRRAFSTRVVVPMAIERAKSIVAVSQATQRDLHRLFPITKNKTTVIVEGVSPSTDETPLVSERFPFDRDMVLFLGTIEPRKNVVSALRAYDRFLQSKPEQAGHTRFVLAGSRGWQTDEVDQAIKEINVRWSATEPAGVIHALGSVTEEEKWNLLRRAACLVFPSLDEGFGLPVLEAMSIGTPVITTRRGALEEVGGDVAIYVEPDDIEAMSLQMAQCLLVPEGVQTLREEGRARAKLFTWDRAAKKVLKVIESM